MQSHGVAREFILEEHICFAELRKCSNLRAFEQLLTLHRMNFFPIDVTLPCDSQAWQLQTMFQRFCNFEAVKSTSKHCICAKNLARSKARSIIQQNRRNWRIGLRNWSWLLPLNSFWLYIAYWNPSSFAVLGTGRSISPWIVAKQLHSDTCNWEQPESAKA